MPLSAGERLGPYEIVAPIGRGGMGEVYQARDTRLDRPVAIKISAARFSERFASEARAIAALNHPNVCTLYDVGPDYLVMELVEGPTLADRIKEGPLPPAEALRIAHQIADALEAAHEKSIVHRDLKPANVKIKPDGLVKVLDFGLAKAMEPRDSGADVTASPTLTLDATRAGMILGTAGYMSPEQARGKPIDRRADIWAFGVVFYEMLTGHTTFEGETVSDTLAAVLRADIDWSRLPADTPPKIRRLLKRCLERDPKRRLRDIGDAWIELDAPDEPATAVPVAKPSLMARWLPWVAAVAIGGAGVGWGLLHIPPPAQPRPVFRWTYTEPNYFGLLTLSHDGSRLVYTQLNGGAARLMLRAADEPEPKPIAGSEDGGYPFLSPDGQWCGFFGQDGKLKKVPVTGGSPLVLVDSGASPPGDWGEDDTIVYSTRQGLARISAAGGTPQTLTTVDTKKGETSHRYARWLPGGRELLFTVSAGATSQVVVLDLKSGATRVLVANGANGRYVPTGHLVYQRANTLFAVPFNLRGLTVTGPEAVVVQGVSSAFNAGGDFAFADSGVLAFMSGTDMSGASVMAWADLKGSVEQLSEPKDWGTGRLSPDGLHVVNSIRAGGGGDIWVFDTVRRTVNRLTSDGTGHDPIWSADGRRVAYGASVSGKSGIYAVPADGSGKPELLLATNTPATPTSWSPDGRRLVYAGNGADKKSHLWSVALPGGTPAQLHDTPFVESDGQVSPDGKWLVYVSNESGANEIYLQPFPEPGAKVRVSTRGGDRPRWSRSGRQLYYWGGLNAGLAAVDIQTTPELRVGLPRDLFQFVAGTTFGVTPDEQHFLVETIPGLQGGRRMELVMNWFDDLRRKAPVSK